MAFRISQETRGFIRDLTGHVFGDETELLNALDGTGLRSKDCNFKLALYGDVILKFALVDEWYPTGGPREVGHNSVRDVGDNRFLAAVARERGLDAHIHVNPGNHGQRVGDKLLAATVEALLAAVYIDSGEDWAAVRTAMTTLGLTRAAATAFFAAV